MSLRHHGGVRVIVDYANHLARSGHGVHIFVPKNQFKPLYPIDQKVRVHLLRNSNEVDLFSRLKTLYDLSKAMRNTDLDVIVANFFPTVYPSWTVNTGTRVVYFIQDTPHLFNSFSPVGVAMRLTYRFNFPRITTSSFIKQGAGVEATVISPGVSANFYPEQDPVLLAEKQHPAVLYFPRKQAYKGMDYFIEAVKHLVESGMRFELWLITKETEALNPFEDMEIPCLIMDGDTDQKLRRLYSSADVYVSSSITEGYNLPPLEAMACGTPVVMTDSGGSSDYARPDENAIVVRPRDSRALARAIKRVLEDKELRTRLRQEGLKTAAMFSSENAARRFEEFLLEVVGQQVP